MLVLVTVSVMVAMMEMAVHRLEVLLNFAAEPLEVNALVETVHHDWPVDDTDAILLKFADGAIGVHSTVLCSNPRRAVFCTRSAPIAVRSTTPCCR